MEYSKNLKKLIQRAKDSAIENKRRNVCLDLLVDALAESSSYNLSIPSILHSAGISPVDFVMGAKLIALDKKENKNPSQNLSPQVRAVLKDAEQTAKENESEKVEVEHLFLSLIMAEKKPKLFSVLFEEEELEGFVKDIIFQFLNGENLEQLSFVNSGYIDDDEEYELEEGGREQLDPFEDNPIISQFATNLNKEAELGKFDGLVNYGDTIEELTTTLCRNKKPSAILVGSAGTGKSSWVEMLAKMIVEGDAPELLHDKVIFSVSLSTMVAGTVYRGQFEERLKRFVEEVKKYDNIILFFDEIHTLIGAGGSGSREGNDLEASNILKPELARGEISVIGATTINEYNQTIKRDPALDRRFERIIVRQPSRFVMEDIAPKIIKNYESFHNTSYSQEFIDNLIPMCEKYMPNRAYPDKVVDVIDHCGAIAKVNFWKMDPRTKEIQEELEQMAGQFDTAKALTEGTEEHKILKEKFSEWESQFEAWCEKISSGERADVGLDILRGFFEKRLNILSKVKTISSLREHLLKRMIGQESSIKEFTKNMITSSYGLQGQNPNKAPTIFAIHGKEGSGKTYFSSLVSNFIKREGGDVLEYNGVEFDHPYKISADRFDANSLCQKVIMLGNPVIIIDDFEKVSNNCISVFSQIFKEGRIQLSNGDIADFSNCKFIITAPSLNSGSLGFSKETKQSSINLNGSLKNYISYSIGLSEPTKESLRTIIIENLERIKENLQEKFIDVKYDDSLVDDLVNKTEKRENQLNYIKSQIEKSISSFIIEKIEEGETKIILPKVLS